MDAMTTCNCTCHQDKLHAAWVRATTKYPPLVDRRTGCIRWQGNVDPVSGYGRFASTEYAHRQAYVEANGPIPDGMHIDHVYANGCRYRDCVNPKHLEAVTLVENTRRGLAVRHAKPIAKCKRNHEFTKANTYVKADGARECRKCRSLRVQKHKRKKAASTP